MTPEEARQLLEQFANTTEEDAEQAYLAILIQLRIMGRPWRGDGPPSEEYLRQSARSTALAKLHEEITRAKNRNEPADEAEAQHASLMEEIYDEAVATLEQEGLPDSWKKELSN